MEPSGVKVRGQRRSRDKRHGGGPAAGEKPERASAKCRRDEDHRRRAGTRATAASHQHRPPAPDQANATRAQEGAHGASFPEAKRSCAIWKMRSMAGAVRRAGILCSVAARMSTHFDARIARINPRP